MENMPTVQDRGENANDRIELEQSASNKSYESMTWGPTVPSMWNRSAPLQIQQEARSQRGVPAAKLSSSDLRVARRRQNMDKRASYSPVGRVSR